MALPAWRVAFLVDDCLLDEGRGERISELSVLGVHARTGYSTLKGSQQTLLGVLIWSCRAYSKTVLQPLMPVHPMPETLGAPALSRGHRKQPVACSCKYKRKRSLRGTTGRHHKALHFPMDVQAWWL